ncbi:hypothetical protein HDU97_002091 [Phlyctochytrium planicorne]|nr:hypothetical protein HDU97_002091 [Phlyctochytrium planicorne]
MLPILALVSIASLASVNAIPAPASVPAGLPLIHAPVTAFAEISETNFAAVDNVSFAKSIIANRIGVDSANFEVTSNALSSHNGVTSIHLVETYNGIPIVNSVANVNLDASGAAFSVGHPASSSSKLAAPSASLRALSAADAVVAFAKAFGYPTAGLSSKLKFIDNKVVGAPFALQDIRASKKYYSGADNALHLVWDLEIRHSKVYWHNVFVDVSSGEILGANNWVSDGPVPKRDAKATTTVVPTTTFKPTTTKKPTSTSKPTTTVKPTSSTGKPTSSTSKPTSSTGKPTSSTGKPTSSTVKPTSSTPKPTSTTSKTTTKSTTKTTTTTKVTTVTTTKTSSSPTSTATAGPIFKVVPFNKNSILDGQVNVGNPVDLSASPKGWTGPAVNGEFTTTGNNVNSNNAGKNGKSRNGGKFDYTYDTTKEPTVAGNVAAATAEVFYLTNKYHDVLYKYGFTEAFSNFQNNNFGKGGKGNDAILANVQADGLDNANFATPPDGEAGEMNMYTFDYTTPQRDGDMETAVVEHELTHGLTNRLTGGNGNANCLSSNESGGMGEGWSDTVAWWATMESGFTRKTDRATGIYVVNDPRGIRQYPYSTSLTTNPHKYSEADPEAEVHDLGEIWSTFLYEVYWNYVELAGFEPDITNTSSQAGNIRFFQDFVDSLKIQPCNPTFLQGRDAWLQATKKNVNGKFTCAIWKGFAKRGLGFKATETRKDVFALPAGC